MQSDPQAAAMLGMSWQRLRRTRGYLSRVHGLRWWQAGGAANSRFRFSPDTIRRVAESLELHGWHGPALALKRIA